MYISCDLLLFTIDPIEWLGAFGTSLAILVAILAIVVTILIGYTVWYSVVQLKEGQRIIHDMKQQYDDIVKKYELSKMKRPEEIVDDIKRIYDPQVDFLREKLEHYVMEHSSAVTALRSSLEQLPSRETFQNENEIRAKQMNALEANVLRKMLDAFLRIEELTKKEQQEISSILSSGPPVRREDSQGIGAPIH